MISLGGITGFAVAEEHVKTSGDLQLCTLVHGAHIRSSDGTDVGTVNDLIIDRQSGRVVNVVVATSEDKLVALPYSAVDTARYPDRKQCAARTGQCDRRSVGVEYRARTAVGGAENND